MSHYDAWVHLVAGGFGGTVGAIVTCPLEVVKTRLQSSVSHLNIKGPPPFIDSIYSLAGGSVARGATPVSKSQSSQLGIWKCLRYIVETEGSRALFKGLLPNLVGVAPSRALYFATYSFSKNLVAEQLPPDAPVTLTHIISAASAGFVSCTLTNPIWFIKTRLQLDENTYGQRTTAMNCLRTIYKKHGFRGFYKGITASYFGISETIIHFVIYEELKVALRAQSAQETSHLAHSTIASAISKTCASVVAYPHEVARTRLRQEGTKYTGFFQTIALVHREEGYTGLYRGLGTQLARQIPNTAIMMTTYEGVVFFLTNKASEL